MSEITADDGARLGMCHWPIEQPRAVLLIVHGLAEHVARYDQFAVYLNAGGIAVVGCDHRGHGRSVAASGTVGFVCHGDGWRCMLSDILAMRDWVGEQYPDLPVFILGQSMGSFLVRCHLSEFGHRYNGAILMATGADPGIIGRIGLAAAVVLAKLFGENAPSPLLDGMSFGSFGKRFKPLRTKFDWLSRDPDEVDRYEDDPLCGFVASAGLFRDLVRGDIAANADRTIRAIPSQLPLLFLSGTDDPVGEFSKGFIKVTEHYQACGCSNVTQRLYPAGRHEMLHEINRTQVFAEVANWVYNLVT